MEFGGGYGALCLAVWAGGFNGQYVIFDLPVFSQVFFFFFFFGLLGGGGGPPGGYGALMGSPEAPKGLFL